MADNSPIDTKLHIEDGNITFERVADVQNVIDSAANLRSAGAVKTEGGDYHLGRIPLILIEKYCNEKGITFHEWCNNDVHVSSLLNNSDYAAFRISQGAA